MFDISDFLCFVVFILCCVFGYISLVFPKKYRYWQNFGVPCTGFRSDIKSLFSPVGHRVLAQYNELAPHRFGGVYRLAKPILVIREPELIQAILIKDFAYFTDRDVAINEDKDPLRAHVINLAGQRWKSVRSKLTPAFSSGKMKAMHPLVEECVRILEQTLKQQRDAEGLEVPQLMQVYIGNVIGICAFGLSCGTITDEASEFTKVMKLLDESRQTDNVGKTLLALIFPRMLSLLKPKSMPQEVEDFFKKITRESKENRASNLGKRNDFMQLLINTQHNELEESLGKGNDKEILFTDFLVAAHVYVFFAAGLDSTTAALGFCLYELALNPEIVDRLHKEIKTTLLAHGGKMSHEALMEMSYMQCVISETLRKYPVAPALRRRCGKPYRISDSSFEIREGTSIVIPTQGLHYDPKYYPNPEKFDPERFNEENKRKIVPGTYLPFGGGPRMCIGMRFAVMEMKAALTLIIGNYSIHPTEKTQIPIIYKGPQLNTPQKGAIQLKFQARENPLLIYNQKGLESNSN